MKSPYFSVVALSLLVAALPACADNSDKYPSLAIRDVERAQGQFTPVTAETATPIRAVASTQELDALVDRALNAHRDFILAESGAIILAGMAREKTIESNTRQQALVALADLIAIRSGTAIVLADLDRLTAEAATAFAPQDEIAAARTKVETLIAGQDGTISELSKALSQ